MRLGIDVFGRPPVELETIPANRQTRCAAQVVSPWVQVVWKHKSQGPSRQSRLDEETIALIKRIAVENRRWGSRRIRDEFLKLGLQVNRGTIRRYMRQARRETPPQHTGQTWATFLANHAPQIWACDFLQTYD